jgi:hypothetical protein
MAAMVTEAPPDSNVSAWCSRREQPGQSALGSTEPSQRPVVCRILWRMLAMSRSRASVGCGQAQPQRFHSTQLIQHHPLQIAAMCSD